MKEAPCYQYNLKKKLAKEALSSCNPIPDVEFKCRYIENFTKAFPHRKGYVVSEEYEKLISSIKDWDPFGINKIKLGTPGGMLLVNPGNYFDFETLSQYKSQYDFIPPPKMCSKESAGEMVELYAMYLCRDIPFVDFANSYLIAKMSEYLNVLKEFKGPKEDCKVTAQTIFRGDTKGDLIGPYVSQFLYYDVSASLYSFEQKYSAEQTGKDYLETVEQFKSNWSGQVPEPQAPTGSKVYITTLRDAAHYVHYDEPSQAYINAARILRSIGCPYNPGNPYTNGTLLNQVSFVSLGITDYYDLLNRGAKLALDAAWFFKWVHLRLRPEEFGYWIQRKKVNGDCHVKISREVLNSKILDDVYGKIGTYLLPQAYAEGCPTHPACPAGHAVIAGCLTTILKAFFDENYVLPKTYVSQNGSSLVELPEKLTVRHELDKLASNMSLFRNMAGVHYRSDALGLQLGEQVAINFLKQIVKRYSVPVRFTFTKRNDKPKVITNQCC